MAGPHEEVLFTLTCTIYKHIIFARTPLPMIRIRPGKFHVKGEYPGTQAISV
jgi:hypothetical protein